MKDIKIVLTCLPHSGATGIILKSGLKHYLNYVDYRHFDDNEKSFQRDYINNCLNNNKLIDINRFIKCKFLDRKFTNIPGYKGNNSKIFLKLKIDLLDLLEYEKFILKRNPLISLSLMLNPNLEKSNWNQFEKIKYFIDSYIKYEKYLKIALKYEDLMGCEISEFDKKFLKKEYLKIAEKELYINLGIIDY